MKIKLLSVVCLTCLAVASLSAQQLQGIIKSGSQPLDYATVYFPELKMGAITDSNGAYKVSGLTPGVHVVEFSSLGYVHQRDTLTFEADATLTLDVDLQEAAYTLPEVFVGNSDEDPAVGIMRRVVERCEAFEAKRLKGKVHSEIAYTQVVNNIPKSLERTVKFLAFATPAKKFVSMMFAYPDLNFVTASNVLIDGKKSKIQDRNLLSVNHDLDAKERKQLTFDALPIDIYTLHTPRLYWSRKEFSKTDYKLTGSYDKNGRTVFVIECSSKSSPMDVVLYVADELYQIVGMEQWVAVKAIDKNQTDLPERKFCVGKVHCEEVFPNLFLPITSTMAIDFNEQFSTLGKGDDAQKQPMWKFNIAVSMKYNSLEYASK